MAMQPVPGRRPTTRKISMKSFVHAVAGTEKDYPVYRFSGRIFIEQPGHNPFRVITPPPSGSGDGWQPEGWQSEGWQSEGWD